MSFNDPPIGLNQNAAQISVGDGEYDNDLLPWIKFMKRQTRVDDNNVTGGETNYIINGFRSTNPLQMNSLDTERGIGETGSAVIKVLHDSNVDEDLINWGNKVVIKMAKNEWELTGNPDSTFLIGYVTGYKKDRPSTGIMEHEMTVTGSKVLFSNRKINYKKSDTTSSSSSFTIRSHIREIISRRSSYPFPSPDLEEQGNFHMDISTDLDTKLGKVNFEMTEAAGAIQQLADIEGARFFVEYEGEDEIVRVEFPNNLHTGIIVKSGDLKSPNDPARYSSYFSGSWDGSGDITGSTGFANRLMTKTQIDRKEFTSQFSNQGSMTLTFRAIAQKFFITETRISDIGLILSRQGEVTSQNNRVNGRLISDNNNSPTGNVICNFNIPLSSIEEDPETIFVNDLNIKDKFVTHAAPAWIVLYQRSGTEEVEKSEPNHNDQQVIRWHHNKNTGTVTDLPSKVAASGDREDNLVWNFQTDATHGPTMCFGVFAEIRHIQEVSDRGSINRYGLVDGEVDTSFLSEPDLIQRYLGALLQYSAKPRITFQTNQLRIPSQFLFKPYQYITLVDTIAYPLGIDVEVQRAHYSFDANTNQGKCRYADVTPMGYFDYKDNDIKCLPV